MLHETTEMMIDADNSFGDCGVVIKTLISVSGNRIILCTSTTTACEIYGMSNTL